MWRHGLDRSGSGKGQVAGICECGDEHSGSIKCGRSDRHDEADSRFCNFSNAPKKTSLLMLYRTIFDVYSELHTSYINAHCAQNVELLNGKRGLRLAVCPILKANAVFGD